MRKAINLYKSLDQDQRVACWFVVYGIAALAIIRIWPVA